MFPWLSASAVTPGESGLPTAKQAEPWRTSIVLLLQEDPDPRVPSAQPGPNRQHLLSPEPAWQMNTTLRDLPHRFSGLPLGGSKGIIPMAAETKKWAQISGV